jgi:RNA polymerase sigma-70 factor (ECF subfamily)
MGPDSALSDEALMARYADGDAGAFEVLFARHESKLYAFFLARSGARERAQDLYQELFLRVHRARHEYDPRRPLSPWLFQIAHRILIDDSRRAFRRREVQLEAHDPACSRAARSEAGISNRDQVRSLLALLTSEERYVLVAAKVHGLGYREVAAALGKSTDAVKKLASRAMQRLRAVPCDL